MTDTITLPRRTTIDDLDQGSEEWLAARRGIVTASIVGNLITTRKLKPAEYDCPACHAPANEPCVSKTKTGGSIKTLHPERGDVARKAGDEATIFETADTDISNSLTLALTAERITGWTEDMYVSDDMLRGQLDEPKARDKYSECYAPVTEVGFMTFELPGVKLGYSPDGLVGEDGLIEIKSRRPKKHLKTILSGQPPIENIPQLQCGLLVSGRAWLDYVSWCGGMPMWRVRVYPDPRWFDAIIAAADTFETNAATMIDAYNAGVDGFPVTARELTEIRF
ncbi:YqaJ viral recombinase family protein [Rhodococcus sp. NPDC057297]|uniref:YqaJ viral recombinase family protein n=1 Tax=Rhodococcus sp. NPDC057297 TaxID=3346090 RepID=UPI00362A249D